MERLPSYDYVLFTTVLVGFVIFLSESAQRALRATGIVAQVTDVVRWVFSAAFFLLAVIVAILWVLAVITRLVP